MSQGAKSVFTEGGGSGNLRLCRRVIRNLRVGTAISVLEDCRSGGDSVLIEGGLFLD
jgi:hypothetical protein